MEKVQRHLDYSEDGNSKDNVGKLHKDFVGILYFAIYEIQVLA